MVTRLSIESIEAIDPGDPEDFTPHFQFSTSALAGRIEEDADAVKLVPKVPMVWERIRSCITLAFVAAIFSFILCGWIPWLQWDRPYAWLIFLGLITLMVAAYLTGTRENAQKGPWLIYDKRAHQIALPRVGQEFSLREVVLLQQVERSPRPRNEHPFELQLITCQFGNRQRWVIEDIEPTSGGYQELLAGLSDRIPIPMANVRRDWITGKRIMLPIGRSQLRFSLRWLFGLTFGVALIAGLCHWFGTFGAWMATVVSLAACAGLITHLKYRDKKRRRI